jgi:amino acid transporter
VGIEFVTPLAEEIKKPRVYIPAAMIIGLVIVLISGLLYGLASIRYVPAEELAGSATPHVDAATAMLGRSGQIWLAIASILATTTTVNTLLCAIPRMLYGMAKKGQAPSFLGRVNRFGAPDSAIVFCAALILVPLLFGIADAETIVTYILAGSLLWILSYIVAHVDLMILRWKHNSAPGAFRTPLYPIPQLLSVAGLVWMVFKISPDPSMSQRIYTLAFVFLGASAVYAAAWVILKEKKGLFQTTPVAELAGGDEEAGAALPEGVAPAPADV